MFTIQANRVPLWYNFQMIMGLSEKYLDDFFNVYKSSFDKDEQEDIKVILKRWIEKRYTIRVYLKDSKAVGFYIIDTKEDLDFSLLTFLAVKKEYRRFGIGKKLLTDSIEFFNNSLKTNFYLLEAKDAVVDFYKKFGFKRVDIDYKIPSFTDESLIDYNLLYKGKGKKLNSNILKDIITDIFIDGYGLDKNDKRLDYVSLLPIRK